MPGLKVLGFSKSWHSACQHLRILSPLKAIGAEFTPMTESLDLQQAIQNCDLVFITRQFPADEPRTYDRVIEIARLHKKSVMYETDDLLTDIPHDHPEWRSYSGNRYRYVTALLEADHVLVTNESLKEALSKYNENIHVMPNYLDDTMWHIADYSVPDSAANGAPLTIGYMGTVTHRNDLQMIEPALVSILFHYEGRVRLKLWGVEPVGRLIDNPWVEHVGNCPGEYDLFVPFFAKQQADIFIAPLTEGRFNSCKSFLKYLEYSTLGVPGIYSLGGQYDRVVQDGVNGFLVGNLLEWQTCLSALIEKPELRASIATKALIDIKLKWLLSGHVDEIQTMFSRAAMEPRKTVPDPALISLAKEAAAWASDLIGENNESRSTRTSETVGKFRTAMDQDHRREMDKMKQRLIRLRAELTASQRHATGLDNLVVNLTQSWAWRVGTVVTGPARNLRQVMGKRKLNQIEIARHV